MEHPAEAVKYGQVEVEKVIQRPIPLDGDEDHVVGAVHYHWHWKGSREAKISLELMMEAPTEIQLRGRSFVEIGPFQARILAYEEGHIMIVRRLDEDYPEIFGQRYSED